MLIYFLFTTRDPFHLQLETPSSTEVFYEPKSNDLNVVQIIGQLCDYTVE